MTRPIENAFAQSKLDRITQVFHDCFALSHNVQLVGNAPEPEYIPANTHCGFNRLLFREDYLASALHEIAHWSIAGGYRKTLRDFGYWYEPEGRSLEQQLAFQEAEIRPQALECLFSLACQENFQVSVDNFSRVMTEHVLIFRQNVFKEAVSLLENGLNTEAQFFFNALQHEFGMMVSRNQLSEMFGL